MQEGRLLPSALVPGRLRPGVQLLRAPAPPQPPKALAPVLVAPPARASLLAPLGSR